MREGRIAGTVSGEDLAQERVAALMMGEAG
jgi:hypothetical protein